LFSSSGYTSREYALSVTNRSHQNLNAYLPINTSNVQFTITDKGTSELLGGVSCTMYKMISNVWTPVESKSTDITGSVQFSYVEETRYKFYITTPGYEEYIFYLDPVLFSSYDIYLDKITIIEGSQDYDDLAIIWNPYTFYNDAINTFNFIIQSPNGALQNYEATLTYPGGTTIISGNNAIGEQLTAVFNISGATTFSTLQLEYYYINTDGDKRKFIYNYPIIVNGTANTFSNMPTYGLGAFERVLIVTICVLFVVGISSLVGLVFPGLVLGLFVFGYYVTIGFIPIWAILPSMFIGVMFLSLKGS